MPVERRLLLAVCLLCILCAAIAVSSLVVVFKQMEVAAALAEVRSVDRFVGCRILWLHEPQNLPQACLAFDLH